MARNDEDRIQASVVQYVRTVAPDVLIAAIPNGGLRTKREAAKLKWTGVLSGMPDLILLFEGGCALWETKRATGRLSPAQKDIHDRLDRMRVPRAVVRSVDDARRELAALGLKTRETT
jgi:hypothetical protein